MTQQDEIVREGRKWVTRRHFFRECGMGLGSMALSALLGEAAGRAQSANRNPLAPKLPHFPAKARRVIYLFQAGGPSHLDLFDYKPELKKFNGTVPPPELLKDVQNVFLPRDAALYASEFRFARHGQSGAELSEALPHLAGVVDDICIVKSIVTDAVNHAPAQIFMNTGSVQFGRPSFGAWTTYGLGSESQNLPAFVVLNSAGGTSGGASNWGSGFLPTYYQGVAFRRSGDPILSLSNPRGISREMQRRTLDVLKRLNEHEFEQDGDPEIATRINAFEMAYRMQESAPELMDLSRDEAQADGLLEDARRRKLQPGATESTFTQDGHRGSPAGGRPAVHGNPAKGRARRSGAPRFRPRTDRRSSPRHPEHRASRRRAPRAGSSSTS